MNYFIDLEFLSLDYGNTNAKIVSVSILSEEIKPSQGHRDVTGTFQPLQKNWNKTSLRSLPKKLIEVFIPIEVLAQETH